MRAAEAAASVVAEIRYADRAPPTVGVIETAADVQRGMLGVVSQRQRCKVRRAEQRDL